MTKPNNFKGAPVPLYVNLVGSYAAVFGGKHGNNDQVKIRSVDLRVRRISNGN